MIECFLIFGFEILHSSKVVLFIL